MVRGERRWVALACALACSLAGCSAGVGAGAAGQGLATGARQRPNAEPAQPNAFFDPSLFYRGLAAATEAAAAPAGDTAEASPRGRLAGGLVPHHNLAAELLSDFFLPVGEDPPEVIFLVGPNHEGLGQRVITGRRAWQTDFGLVEADLPSVAALEAAGLAAVDEEALAAEHAMGALMPYIEYHAPDARVVPLVLHREMSMAQLRGLAAWLARQLGEDRLLLASVDFSHYLTRAEAEVKDGETLRLIQERDLAGLMEMGPDHLDSPGSLSVLMLAMAELGAEGPHVLGHTNSGVILRDDLIETTSYFTLTFNVR